jgi:hypothetical protein
MNAFRIIPALVLASMGWVKGTEAKLLGCSGEKR